MPDQAWQGLRVGWLAPRSGRSEPGNRADAGVSPAEGLLEADEKRRARKRGGHEQHDPIS